MNKEDLKSLVKQYFNLTEVETPAEETAALTFGEIADENGAFKIVFEGDVLEVGKAVKVVTTEGQELEAPDGYHKLANGKTIKTEAGVVTEIEDTKAEEDLVEEEVTEDKEEPREEFSAEDIIEAISEIVNKEINALEAKITELKAKVETFSATPAAEKTLPQSFAEAKVDTEIVNKDRFEMMKNLMKNK
jgi:hypothetical protein